MSLRHALLGLLVAGPRTGYGLVKHFSQSLNYAWPAGHSQIYPELARLREAGLIRQTGEGPRGSKTYETTEAGATAVRRWLLETEPERRVRSDAALRTFFLWLLDRDQAVAHLERERDVHRALLVELEAIADEEPDPSTPKERSYRLALEGGIRVTRARLEWAEWAIEEVRSRPWSGG
jgi:PadR family transcriptional regulator, regulatory protein AphA